MKRKGTDSTAKPIILMTKGKLINGGTSMFCIQAISFHACIDICGYCSSKVAGEMYSHDLSYAFLYHTIEH